MVPIDCNGFWSFVYSKKTAMLLTSRKREVNWSIWYVIFIFPTPTLAKQQCLKDGRCKRQMFSWLTYNRWVLFHVATYFVALLTLHLQTLNDTIFANLRR